MLGHRVAFAPRSAHPSPGPACWEGAVWKEKFKEAQGDSGQGDGSLAILSLSGSSTLSRSLQRPEAGWVRLERLPDLDQLGPGVGGESRS